MAAKKKNFKPIENRPISTKELKYWLRGILEFQSETWLPNSDQWNTIKSKIFNLIENENMMQQVNAPQQVASQMQSGPQQQVSMQSLTPPPTGGVAPNATDTFPDLTPEQIKAQIDSIKKLGINKLDGNGQAEHTETYV